jgi:hypothetical protein
MFTILGSLTGLTSENDEDEETSYEPSPKKQKSTSVGKVFRIYSSQKTFFVKLKSLHHRNLLRHHLNGILNYDDGNIHIIVYPLIRILTKKLTMMTQKRMEHLMS